MKKPKNTFFVLYSYLYVYCIAHGKNVGVRSCACDAKLRRRAARFLIPITLYISLYIYISLNLNNRRLPCTYNDNSLTHAWSMNLCIDLVFDTCMVYEPICIDFACKRTFNITLQLDTCLVCEPTH